MCCTVRWRCYEGCINTKRKGHDMRYITQKTPANRFTVIDTRDGSQLLFPTDLISAATFAGTLNKQEAAYLAARNYKGA